MRRLLIVPSLALLLAGCEIQMGPVEVVQGSGKVKTESREIHGFDRVRVTGIGTLTITQGATEALTVEAEDNLLPRLRSEVQNGTLLLSTSHGTSMQPTKPIRYDLTMKQLRAIDLTGAPNASADGLTADQLALDLSGAGRMNLAHVTTGSLTVHMSGAGQVTVSGQTPQQTVSLSGAGRYQASDLASERATVDVSGAGSCAVKVSDHLAVTLSGAGEVTYTGSPAVDENVTGVGRVTRSG